MKNIILSVLSLCFTFLVTCGCDASGNGPAGAEEHPLKSFSLAVGNTFYRGRIDHLEGTVSVGNISYGSDVSDVDYSLAKGAIIEPDPEEFVGAWPEEVDFTVTLDGKETVYTVTLTAFVGMDPEPGPGPGDDLHMPLKGKILYEENFDRPGIPDKDSWSLCNSYGSNWDRYMSGSYDQAFVEDGLLVLQSGKVNGEYKAGGIESIGKKYFRHARFEICARFKTAQGAWPAIWLMPEEDRLPAIYKGWPNGGEIDIMEQISNEKVVYQTVHSHYTYDLGIKNPNPTVTPSYRAGEFNNYAVDVTPDEIVFYVNGDVKHRYPNLHLSDEAEKKQWPFDSDYYIILNVALGGPGTWPGEIEDSELPARMEVDWVRVSSLAD